jgi:prepilin-type N-terminal cleavage/methylation domain-containing protein
MHYVPLMHSLRISLSPRVWSPRRPISGRSASGSGFRRQRERSAFTLIELLVVIAIISILAGLGFGAVQGAMKSAKRAQARNDVNQVAAAVKSYLLEYGRLPEAGTEVAALTGENPKGIVFFEAKNAAGSPPKNGLSGGQLLDPWGNAYTFVLDDDYDNKVDYDGQEFVTTVVVASEGDSSFKISNVKDTPK